MRIEQEKRELQWLSPLATCSVHSKGRRRPEEQCKYRTAFQRDRDRIIHAKAFRRLKHKTQVFLSPEGDHYRTRLTHVLEVSQISRTIARALRLNEDLTEAIALGHDLGHTPFGHCGEVVLNRIHEGGFHHAEQSLRVVDFLEFHGEEQRGLNLTDEVRDGIRNHTGSREPYTLEGQVVRLSDRIAYINHDIEDALRAGVLAESDLPGDFIDYFGNTKGLRIDKMIVDVIETSRGEARIRMSPESWRELGKIRTFMFKNVYLDVEAKAEEAKAMKVVEYLYYYYLKNSEKLPKRYYEIFQDAGAVAVKDFIAGMSDRYAVNRFKAIAVPKYWQID
ncbi:MAG: deoxyguanosinetriphosphate triphosphohydrolase [Clostridiales bacterium]|nr:MAG: deoxyguanosinetriphosphate triphosphohydrolase [Clostridiales bacterium]